MGGVSRNCGVELGGRGRDVLTRTVPFLTGLQIRGPSLNSSHISAPLSKHQALEVTGGNARSDGLNSKVS